jgi:hypothetical protein
MESEAGESRNETELSRADVAISAVNPSASEMRTTPPAPPTPPVPVVATPPVPPVPRPMPAPRLLTAEIEAHTSEFAADVAGSLSPFGDDIEFPLPIERLGYHHPGPANRPVLAGD